jgi:hypothetical protein
VSSTFRLDLGEAVDDAANAELGRAARPGGADARTAEEGRNRLGDVGEIGGDAIACHDACLAQGAGDSAGTCPQLAPRPITKRTQLGGMSDRHLVVGAAAEDVLRVAEPRAGEPLRTPASRAWVSTRSYGSLASTSKNSQIERQKSSSSSTDHCHRSA